MLPRRPNLNPKADQQVSPTTPDLPHATPLSPAHFTLRDDGTIQAAAETQRRRENKSGWGEATDEPAREDARPTNESEPLRASVSPRLMFTSDAPFLRLYHGNSLELLDAIYAKYGEAGRFDCIFADPPYFLSNGGITCHAGKMVKVDMLGAKKE